MNKKVLVIVFFIAVSAIVNAENTPKDVVTSFGKALSAWCQSGDISYRIELERLCNGVKKCRVEDKIHAEYQRKSGFVDDGKTFVLDSYLNMFQSLMSEGIRFSMSNITVETQDHYPDGQVLTFITADIRVSGKLNYTVKDLFLVRDDKISGIYTYSSIYGFKHLNGKLINALKKNNYLPDMIVENHLVVLGIGGNGLINLKGDVVIPCEWDIILNEGPFAMGARNTTGRPVGPEWGWHDETSAVYDLRNGNKTTFDGLYTEIDHSLYHPGWGRWQMLKDVFNDGYAVVYKIIDGKLKYGYLKENDLTYNVRYIYDEAHYFQNGYAPVKIGDKSMLIDENLNVVLILNDAYEFGLEWYFNKNQFIVFNKRTHRSGVIGINGEWVIKSDKYYSISSLGSGLAKVNLESPVDGGKYGFINARGDIIIPCIYEDAYRFINGICLVSKYGCYDYEIIDTFGNSLLNEMKLEFPDPFDSNSKIWSKNSIILKNTEGKWAMLNNKGIPYPGFSWLHDELRYYNEDFIVFKVGKQSGIINIHGQIIVPTIYDDINDLNNGVSCVYSRCKFGCINELGALIVPCEYDEYFEFENGIALVTKGNQNGIIDMFGNSYFW